MLGKLVNVSVYNRIRMIDIDTQFLSIKVACYLMMCRECQIDTKNWERDKKPSLFSINKDDIKS